MSEYSLDDLSQMAPQAVELAAELLQTSRERESSEEKSRSAMMARMMHDEPGKKFTIAMADQVLRMRNPIRASKRLQHLVEQYGVPQYFDGFDRFAVGVGSTLSDWFPKIIMPQIRKKVRQDSEHVIIPAEENHSQNILKIVNVKKSA